MHLDKDGGAPAGEAEHESDKADGGTVGAGNEAIVSLADEGDDDLVLGEEGKEDDDGESADAESEEEAGQTPRKRTRTQRFRERIARLAEELDAERRRSRMPARAVDDDDLIEPREEDFPDDYLAYDRAVRDFQIRRALREERRRDAQAHARFEAEAAFREKLAGYTARLDSLKSRIPDFDAVVREAGRAEIRDDVRDLVLASAKGPLIAYYLARNPEALDDINRMPPTEAARRIGNLEARIRGPNPSTATRARAPVTPPRGGASVSRVLDPDRMSHEDYRKARAAGRI